MSTKEGTVELVVDLEKLKTTVVVVIGYYLTGEYSPATFYEPASYADFEFGETQSITVDEVYAEDDEEPSKDALRQAVEEELEDNSSKYEQQASELLYG